MAGRQPSGGATRPLAATLAAVALMVSAPAALPQETDTQRADALCAAGETDYQEAAYQAAHEKAQQCADMFDRLASQQGIGRANHLLSIIADVEGDRAESMARARRAIAAYESADNRRGRAVATLQLVRVARLDRAEETRLLEEVIGDARAAGDRSLEGRALHSLADHFFTAGRYEDAFDRLNEAAAIFSAIDDGRALGRVYNSMGRL